MGEYNYSEWANLLNNVYQNQQTSYLYEGSKKLSFDKIVSITSKFLEDYQNNALTGAQVKKTLDMMIDRKKAKETSCSLLKLGSRLHSFLMREGFYTPLERAQKLSTALQPEQMFTLNAYLSVKDNPKAVKKLFKRLWSNPDTAFFKSVMDIITPDEMKTLLKYDCFNFSELKSNRTVLSQQQHKLWTIYSFIPSELKGAFIKSLKQVIPLNDLIQGMPIHLRRIDCDSYKQFLRGMFDPISREDIKILCDNKTIGAWWLTYADLLGPKPSNKFLFEITKYISEKDMVQLYIHLMPSCQIITLNVYMKNITFRPERFSGLLRAVKAESSKDISKYEFFVYHLLVNLNRKGHLNFTVLTKLPEDLKELIIHMNNNYFPRIYQDFKKAMSERRFVIYDDYSNYRERATMKRVNQWIEQRRL